jgi:RNA polymerase sigma-70 factor (ECF subfamily)
MPTDEELMISVSAGDLRAFEQLIQRHQSSAWQAAYRFLGDASEAEDIAQEAFLKILDAAPRYQPTAAFRTYLYRVITRLCLDFAQKKRPLYTQFLPEIPRKEPSPIDVLARSEQKQGIRQALNELPGKQRMAVILRYYEGLGYAEMAVALGVTPKAVERLLARARESLEQLLMPLLESTDRA